MIHRRRSYMTYGGVSREREHDTTDVRRRRVPIKLYCHSTDVIHRPYDLFRPL